MKPETRHSGCFKPCERVHYSQESFIIEYIVHFFKISIVTQPAFFINLYSGPLSARQGS